MSVPASAYSYSEYTIAPSEASLNARWYNQIQQWTHDLPPESASAVGTDRHHHSQGTIVSRRPRDADDATERGTILPTHSVSRRASLTERRQWDERQAEYARRAALKEILPKIQEASIRDRSLDPEVDRRSVVTHSRHTVTSRSKAPSVTESVIHSRTKESNDQQRLAAETSPAIPVSAKTLASKKVVQTTLHLQDVEDDVSNRPSRGRRPPTPYHAPSNLALSEISESSVGDSLGKGDDSAPKHSKEPEGSSVTEVRPRTRYPPPLSRKVAPPSKVTAIPSPNLTQRPHSHHSADSTKPTDPVPASQRHGPSKSKPLQSPPPSTDHSSFPPLSTNPRDMTVVPEDSISRVTPMNRSHGETRRKEEIPRDHARDRHAESEYTLRTRDICSRRRSKEREQPSDSGSSSDESSTTSRSRASSARSSPRLGVYTRQTLSPPIPSRRPSLGNPPYRMASPAISNIRPSVSAGFPYMAQPLPMSPISPLSPPMHPVHFNAPTMASHQWSIPPSFSSANLSSPPPLFAQQWPPFRGPSQISMGNHPYSPPMQPYFNGMSMQGPMGPNPVQRRGSAISPAGGLTPASAPMRQPPLPSRSGSMPLPVRVSSTGIVKDRGARRSMGMPGPGISSRPSPTSKGPLQDTRTRQMTAQQGIITNANARRPNVRPSNPAPIQATGAGNGAGNGAGRRRTPKPAAMPTPRMSTRGNTQTTRRSQALPRNVATSTQRPVNRTPVGANGGKGLGWMKGLLPPYGRPSQ